MKEYTVKITEIRYEYVDAETEEEAIKKAKQMVLTNADEVKFEVK